MHAEKLGEDAVSLQQTLPDGQHSSPHMNSPAAHSGTHPPWKQ
jgi:hypothetical protein